MHQNPVEKPSNQGRITLSRGPESSTTNENWSSTEKCLRNEKQRNLALWLFWDGTTNGQQIQLEKGETGEVYIGRTPEIPTENRIICHPKFRKRRARRVTDHNSPKPLTH